MDTTSPTEARQTQPFWKRLYSGYGNILALFGLAFLLILLGEIFSPGFATLDHVLILLKTSSLLGVIVLAQSIVIISGNEGIDLSVGAMATIGAVMGATIINGADRNLIFAVPAVLLTGFLLGSVNGFGVTYFRIPPLIMTLGMASVINGMVIIYSQGFIFTGSASELLKVVGGGSTYSIPNMLVVWLIITVLATLVLVRTRAGVSLYGVGANELTAELNGVRSKRVRALAYAVAGAVAALGGLFLLGYIGLPFINIGEPYVLPSVAAAVIGGISLAGGAGSYLGAVAGTIVLTTLNALLVTAKMGEGGKQIVFGFVLLGLLVIYNRSARR